MVYFIFVFNGGYSDLCDLIYKYKSKISLICDSNKSEEWFIDSLCDLIIHDRGFIRKTEIDHLMKFSHIGIIRLTKFLHNVRKLNLTETLVLDNSYPKFSDRRAVYDCLDININKKDLIAWSSMK